MAHQVESMAYVGVVPWHGLGNKLTARQPLEVWAREAGMEWEIKETPVRFMTESAGALGAIESFDDHKVLFRSDTLAPLSVVSNRYHVVQPHEILAFYKDLTEVSGFELETAGVLKGGRKLWALARTGKSVSLRGNDVTHGYVLLATACDGTLKVWRPCVALASWPICKTGTTNLVCRCRYSASGGVSRGRGINACPGSWWRKAVAP